MNQAVNNRRGVWLTLGAGVLGAIALTTPVWLIFAPEKQAEPAQPAMRPEPVTLSTPPADPEPAPPAPPPDFQPKAPPAQKAVGFTLHGYEGAAAPDAYLDAIDAMADSGATAMQLIVPIYSGHARSNSVQLLIGPGRSVPPQRIVAILQHAKLRDLHTTLTPVLVLAQPRSVHEWRGAIDPTDWDQWWRSYQMVLDQLVGLANQAGVDALCVGNELWSTERQTQRWVDLVAHVRSGFTGHLYYATAPERREVPAFWAHVDFVGVNFDTDEWSETPHAAALTQHRDELVAFADLHDRPLIVAHVSDREQPAPSSASSATTDRVTPDSADEPIAAPAWPAATLRSFVESWRPLVAPAIAMGSHEPDDRRDRIAGLYLDQWPITPPPESPDADTPPASAPAAHTDRQRLLQRLLEEQQ